MPPADIQSPTACDDTVSSGMQEVLDTLHQPFLVLAADLRVVAASPAFHRVFGLAPDAVAGRSLFALGDGEWEIPALRVLLETLVRERDRVEGYEVEQEHPGGTRALSCNVRALPAEGGRAAGYLVAIEDVTARRVASRPAPPQEEPAARIVTDRSSDLVLLYDGDGTLRYASESAASILGFTPAELLETGTEELLHPGDADEYHAFFRDALEGGVSQGLAYRVRNRAGETIWLGCTARPVRDDAGAIVQVQLVGRDVTQRKRSEEALRWLSRQVRMILNSAGEGIFGLDQGGSVSFINPVALRMLGRQGEEVVGRPYHELFDLCREDGSALPPEECAIRLTLRDGAPRSVHEEMFGRADGTRFPADYTVTPALDGGRIVGAVVTFRDATGRREAESNLRRAEWLAGIGQTALAVRHEINNPLTSMLADAALLEMAGNTPEEEREMVASIIRQARRIRDVVQRLGERKDSPSLRQVGTSRMLDLSESE
ncbi:MAG TPA: PAS domain-containing protein [Longimicrobiaceae bacterium]|nr:PAS domain-containing protein [Longimicrobiaceae bacterium]